MLTDEHEHAMNVWWEALAATGNFVRFNSKSEKAAAAVIAADRAGMVARIAELEEALKQAEAVFTHYGELHAAKPDPVKARRNFDLADAMRAALKDTRNDT